MSALDRSRDDRRLAQLRRLTEVSRALTNAIDLDRVLELTAARAAELLDADAAALMLTDDEGVLSVRATWGVSAELAAAFAERLDETLITRLRALLHVPPDRLLAVPLVVEGAVIGLLAVALKRSSPDDENEWLLSVLADQAAVALEKTRLDEAAQFRERVIGIVSHDLRTPIAVMVLGAEVFLGTEGLDPKLKRVAERIQASGERAGRLIRDLLDYTQAHLGNRIAITRQSVDVGELVARVVDEVSASHGARPIELKREGDLLGSVDPDRLAQVLGNLLDNATMYGAPSTPILVELCGEPHSITLAVHNEGEPIPADKLSKIFEPMQRAVGHDGSSRRSVGLGLYIVKHLVEAHGGSIDVTSDAEHGTTFTIRLPRA